MDLNFINDYYISYRKEYAKQDKNGYKTIKRTLTDKNIQDHLKGRYAIAIKVNKASKFLGLDLDTKDIGALETVYEALLSYFKPENILITDSGSKGYHIDLFFNELMNILELKKLYNVILEDTGISSNILEARGHNNQAYKLPFGIHQKTGNKCNVVNHFGIKSVFKKPEKIDPEYIQEIIKINYVTKIKEYQGSNKTQIKTAEQKLQELENAYKYGITAQKQRHKKTYNVVMYLKNILNYSQSETFQTAKEWINNELKRHKQYINSDYQTIEQELKATVKSVYKNDSKIVTYRNNIQLTTKDLKEITSVENENKQRIYFVLYFYAKSFQATTKNNKGSFYCSYKDIQKLSGIKYNKTIKKYIDQLVKENKITILYRERHQSTIYRINNLQSTSKDDFILSVQRNKNNRFKDYFKLLILSYKKTLTHSKSKTVKTKP
jgi:hypothetical protein